MGAVLASGLWGAVLYVVTMSGTVSISMGVLAEQWTAQELRRLRKIDWQIVNGLRLRPKADIDHVIIGPGGVLVIETKYSSDGWNSTYANNQVAAAVDQVTVNQKHIRGVLSRDVPRELIRPVVVLWGGSTDSDETTVEDEVAIVPGSCLRSWLLSLNDEGLSDNTIDAAWKTVADHIRRREAFDLTTNGPPLRSVSGRVWRWSVLVCVGALAFVAEDVTLGLTGAEWVFLIGPAFAMASWVAGRAGLPRPWRNAWLIGILFVTTGLSVAYIAEGLIRWLG
jgi:hypothetical protein